MTRVALFALLAVVAGAAAVLSFSALRDLALVCGFAPALAWLLPVTIDAGAAAGSLVWLTRPTGSARSFGRNLALVLLGSSVAGNAIGHALEAFATRPHWTLVVAVSGVAPAVLGAVVHLAVLTAQNRPGRAPEPTTDGRDDPGDPLAVWDLALPVGTFDFDDDPRIGGPCDGSADRAAGPTNPPTGPELSDRAAELIAAGASRRRLARELGISEHRARTLLAAYDQGSPS